MLDLEELFNDSYARILIRSKNSQDFFDIFYQKFISASPVVAEKFKHTDMNIQKKMLKKSFTYLLNLYITRKCSNFLDKVAEKHSKSQHDIHAELYDLWLDCLIDTVKELDPKFNNDVELSWRSALSIGITYMKFKYDKDDS